MITGPSGTSTIDASLIVGADGRHSKVAELSNAPIVRRAQHASAVVYGYWQGLDIREYWWSYGNQVSAGAIPTNDGETCVFASIPAAHFQTRFGADLAAGYHEVIAASDAELDSRLRSARRTSALRGFPGMAGYVRQSIGPGWALVGDAAHFKDPITAHGITDALRDAELLAGAIQVWHAGGVRGVRARARSALAADLRRIGSHGGVRLGRARRGAAPPRLERRDGRGNPDHPWLGAAASGGYGDDAVQC